MSERGRRIRKKLRGLGSNIPVASQSVEPGDSICFYCRQSYNPGQEGQHHFPACDICGDLGHAGCKHS